MTDGLFLHRDALVRFAYAINAWILTHRSLGDTPAIAQDMTGSRDALLRDIGGALTAGKPVIADKSVVADAGAALALDEAWQTPVGKSGKETTLGELIMSQIERHLQVVGPPAGTSLARYVSAVAGHAQREEITRHARGDDIARALLPRTGARDMHLGARGKSGTGVGEEDLTWLALLRNTEAVQDLSLTAVCGENIPLALVADAAGIHAQAYRKPSRQDTVRETVDLSAERHERQRRQDQRRESAPRVHSTGAGWS